MKLNALTRFIWSLVQEVGEEKAQGLIRVLVREMNEEVQQFLADPEQLAEFLAEVPPEMQPVVIGIIGGLAGKAEEKAQEVVNQVWAESEKINPSDTPQPAPDVDFDGMEEDDGGAGG